MSEPMTKAGRALLAREALNSRSFALITAEAVAAIEAEAIAAERDRLSDEVGRHLSLSAHPIWAHVDSYGLGQLLQGKPWPEGR